MYIYLYAKFVCKDGLLKIDIRYSKIKKNIQKNYSSSKLRNNH